MKVAGISWTKQKEYNVTSRPYLVPSVEMLMLMFIICESTITISLEDLSVLSWHVSPNTKYSNSTNHLSWYDLRLSNRDPRKFFESHTRISEPVDR